MIAVNCRSRPTSSQRLQQQSPARLAVAIGVAGASGEGRRLAEPPGREPAAGEVVAGEQEQAPKTPTLDVRPPLELGAAWRREAGEKVATVEPHRGFEVLLLDRLQERRTVAVEGHGEGQRAGG
ncbi:MAG: hypothetical protein ABR998_08670 [Gemmatimonadales bacterium]